MSEEGIKSDWRCPRCGRENQATAARCSLCLAERPGEAGVAAGPSRRPLSIETDEDYPEILPGSSPPWLEPTSVGAFILIACGLLVPLYGVGVALFVALIPALIRIFRAAKPSSAEPVVRPADSTGWTCGQLASAVSVTFLVVVSSFIAFVAVCLPVGSYAVVGLGPEGMPVQVVVWLAGLAGGLLTAGAIAYGIARLFFRSERRQGEPWEPPGEDVRP